MITAKLFLSPSSRILYSKAIYCLIFIVLLFSSLPANAEFCGGPNCEHLFDGECSGGTNPASVKDCTGGMCGICDPNTGWNGWVNPNAQVIFMPSTYTWSGPGGLKMPIYKKTIDIGKCKNLNGTRFCVRPTQSGDPGNDTNPSRPQICAYEDSCDATDPPDGDCAKSGNISPFHYMTKNIDALSISQSAQYGAIAGTAFGPFGVGFGAALGAMVAGITQDFNQVVPTTIGCIDRKIGPMPPTWKNSAWFDNALPTPVFSDAGSGLTSTATTSGTLNTASIFESPLIYAKVCWNAANQIIACTLTNAIVYPEVSKTLNPNSSNSFMDCKPISNRTYCASVTQDRPDKVLIQARDGTSTNYNYTYIQILDRAGYMPKPTVEQDSVVPGTGNFVSKMKITMRGQSIVLAEAVYTDGTNYLVNPTSPDGLTLLNPNDKQTDYLYNTPFSIQRPCISSTITNGHKTCTQYDNIVCAYGYDTAPKIAVDANDNAIAGVPNQNKLRSDGAFYNIHSNQESGDYLNEAYTKDVWVYPYNVTSTSTPMTSTYTFNSATSGHTIRPLTPSEAGLCLYTAPDMRQFIFPTPGNYNFTVPTNCTQVQVQLWGGGAAGNWHNNVYNGDENNKGSSGGAGGYFTGTIGGLTAGQSISIVVGAGGTTIDTSGTASSISINAITATASPGIAASLSDISRGGSSTYSGSFTNITRVTGGDGINSDNGYENGGLSVAGGAAYSYSGQSASLCPNRGINGATPAGGVGAGGCSHGDNAESYRHCTSPGICSTRHREDPGSWGVGGNGQVTIQCVSGRN